MAIKGVKNQANADVLYQLSIFFDSMITQELSTECAHITQILGLQKNCLSRSSTNAKIPKPRKLGTVFVIFT